MITMQAISTHTLATALALAVAATLAGQVRAGSALVKFPDSYTAGVLYATVDRGNITEEIFTSRAAIDVVKNGQPIPSGALITLVDYRDGELFRSGVQLASTLPSYKGNLPCAINVTIPIKSMSMLCRAGVKF
jgi:hypothetical protein